MLKFLTNILGDSNEKELKKLYPIIDAVNGLEPEVQALSDDALRAKTGEFRQRLAEGETLDDLLPEAFAVAREAIRRTVGERAYDVQLMGAAVLQAGKIAELKTGEGKTLVAAIALYLNALEGRGAHLVTVNDYLAKRDAQWYGRALARLGLTVGVLQHDASFLVSEEKVSDTLNMEYLVPCTRREAYAADVTYGTNHEFGFDYLRDNMATSLDRCVQRELHYAIVDEVDNILIDEARTPLIISGPAQESTDICYTFARIAPRLQEDAHYTIDLKARAVLLTEEGIAQVEKLLGIQNIYAPENFRLTRYMEAALKAHALYKRDVDYVVKDGEVVIVDDFTGRLMHGRRWSDGLHQAVEAKEGLKVQQESITYATITLQNYFRLYDKLAGMTGTAVTEAEEFYKIYKLEVVVIPTHRPMVREDFADLVYKTEKAKFDAVAEEVEELHSEGRPVLVGTVSIEKSEYLSELLKRRGVPHQVLNAKHHEKEAMIVAQAGRLGTVTIATNMAGRGTDIILGGKPDGRDPDEWRAEHEKVVELGGLHIIGTERHESRRIDNQLRGRAGRQGDPGSSRFYVSFEDDIMRRFAPEWLPGMLTRLGMEDHVPIESRAVSRAIETAQTKVEGHNFDIRKHVVEYDDVMNTQRDVIYRERRKILEGADVRANVLDMLEREVRDLVDLHLPPKYEEQWDYETLLQEIGAIVALPSDFGPEQAAQIERDELLSWLVEYLHAAYEAREREIGHDLMRQLERAILLRTIDSLWVLHLTEMDAMRQGIGLQGYAQQDPLVAYKREAYDMWEQLLANIRRQVARSVFHVQIARPAEGEARVPVGAAAEPRNLRTNQPVEGDGAAPARGRQPVGAGVAARKVGRNDPCPCGSGKKYKKCHGMAA